MRYRSLGLGLLAMLATAACSDSTGTGAESVQLTVALTDAADTLLSSVVVHVGRVELIPADGARLTVNGQFAKGRPFPRQRDERTHSTCALAFSESWLLPY